jgi:hypothetical protein
MATRRPKLTPEDWLLLLVVPASSVAAWFLPEEYRYGVFAALVIGVLFDLISLVAHVHTLIPGRFASGLPLVGLFFYGWFVLAYRRSLLAPHETAVPSVVLYKVLDLLFLAGVHLLCQLPMFFQGPRDQYPGGPRTHGRR